MPVNTRSLSGVPYSGGTIVRMVIPCAYIRMGSSCYNSVVFTRWP